MRIALMIASLTKGGAERVMVNLADYFADYGHEVILVTQYIKENEYPLNQKVKRIICELSEEELTDRRVTNFKRRFTKLRNIWKVNKPDVILSFIGKNNIMTILTSRFLDIPVAVSVRAEPGEEYPGMIMRLLARNLFKMADKVILQTKQCFDFFPEAVQRKAVILKNPVSEHFFRERFTGERDKVIVAVGRVDENKNHEMLIRAFAGIADEFPDYKVVIYGEGDCRSKLLDLVQELGLSGRILLPGSIENVSEAIYKTRVFVLTSNSEGSPNTLIEAMAMGLTVISTDCPCGGPAELILDNINGILTPVGDVEKLQVNLQKVLNDLQFADNLGEKAKETSDIFRRDKVCKEWESILSEISRKRE